MSLLSSRQLGLRRWAYLDRGGLCLVGEPIGRGIDFEKHERFEVLHQGFIEQIPWEETKYYKKAAADIRGGKSRWKCRTIPELRDRFYRELPRLYDSIRDRGFLTQRELMEDRSQEDIPLASRLDPQHEIKIGMNERGDLIFLDGAHRLGIARIQKIERIPVRLMFVHEKAPLERLKELDGFSQEYVAAPPSDSSFERKGLFGGLVSKDGQILAGVRPSRTLRKRNLIVASSLRVEGKRVLDVGCAEGLTSLYLSERAKEVIGVDHRSSVIRMARTSAQFLGKENVQFSKDDIRNEAWFKRVGRFDLVVAWGLLHRITDPFELMYRLAELTDTISLEWPTPVVPRMEDISLAWHPTHGVKLDPLNTSGIDDQFPADDSEKIEGNTGFWEMTPGAVKTILGRLGFSHYKVLGYGESFAKAEAIIKKKYDPIFFTKKSDNLVMPNERLHMIASRHPVDAWIDENFKSARCIPEWDLAGSTQIARRKIDLK